MALTDKLKAIADAIRSKGNTTAKLTLAQMPQAILDIQTGSGDVPFGFGGLNATKVAEYSESWSLEDTSFVKNSSASTTATSILAGVSNRYTNTTGSPTDVNYGAGDIVVVQKCYVKPTHGSGSTNTAKQVGYAYICVSHFSRRKTTDTSSKTTMQVYNYTASMNKYYNTSGSLTRAVASYGLYMTPAAPTVSSSTASYPYVRCTSPTLYYRASSTYESTTNIKTVTACKFDWKVEVYTVDKDTTITAAANDTLDSMLIAGGIA